LILSLILLLKFLYYFTLVFYCYDIFFFFLFFFAVFFKRLLAKGSFNKLLNDIIISLYSFLSEIILNFHNLSKRINSMLIFPLKNFFVHIFFIL